MKIFSKLILIVFFPFIAEAVSPELKQVTDFVENNADKVIEIMETKEDLEKKSALLTKIFEEVMDIDWMGRFVLGSAWNSLSANVKNDYLKSYRKYLVKSYVPKFRKFNGQKFKILGVKDIGNSQYIVSCEIMEKNDAATYNVQYRIKKLDSGLFKVRDIIAEDVSLITTERSDFSSTISSDGMAKLIEQLQDKTD